jgi:hypothetical protein
MTEATGQNRSSARALAEMARSGYASLRHPSMDVDFEVHHFRDRRGHLKTLLDGTASNGLSGFVEIVSSTANGAGLVIGTNVGATLHRTSLRDRGGMRDPRPTLYPADGLFRFVGGARPNLTFLYENGQRFEAIVAVSTAPGALTVGDAGRLRDIVHKVSEIAVNVGAPDGTGAPLLSVQSPVQLPPEPDATSEDARYPWVSSKAVRFSIAAPAPTTRNHLEIAERITEFCQENGYSLWLRDTRPGYRTGNWFKVLNNADRGARDSGTQTKEVGRVVPVTFVGPARIGSTRAVVAALRKIQRVGVAACSITLLDDLAFIHLQLVLSEDLTVELTKERFVGMDAGTFVRDVLCTAVAYEREQVIVEDRAADYQTLAGPSIDYVGPGDKRIGIWFSWQMNRSTAGIKEPIRTLTAALDTFPGNPSEMDANIEYLTCRDLGNAVLRGKGKISVPYEFVRENFSAGNDEPGPSQFSVALEDAWKSAVAKEENDNGSNSMIRDITVAWREHWLGHWAAPIA